MKIFLMLLGGLAVLGALVAAVGARLPRAHQASRQAAAALYAVVRDFAAAGQWRRGVQSAEMLPAVAGQVRYREVSGHGATTYRVLEDRPGQRLVVEIADRDLPYGGTWTFAFTRDGETTVLRITEQGFVGNPVFRFLARFVFGHTTTLEQYLRDLGRKFGETTRPQP